MGDSRLLTADRGDAGRRLDLVLQRHLKDVATASRNRIQTWIESGQVAVNGALVRRVSTRTAQGDVVSVMLPEASPPMAMAPEDVPLDVLYEDEYLLAVNKPAGIVVHPTYRHATGTLMNALLWHARRWPRGQRPSLVGRLDKLTSGILLVAKTRSSHAALQRLVTSARCEKDYLAIVYGRVNAARGQIELRLARDPRDRRKVVASTTAGAPSVTAFERLRRVTAAGVGLSLLRCRLYTGRMHQIRVHLAARGWPIVGDPKYGEARWRDVVDPVLASALATFPRQALHAWHVALVHPFTSKVVTIKAGLPPDLQGLLRATGLGDPKE
jgi:23S rRNA pseudouridine1911/1915/1917 synthase